MTTERRLVLIEWEDSHSSGAWQEVGGEIEDRALVCRSVGWLVLDGENAKVVAPHINEQEPGVALQACGVMTIPARSVLSITDLHIPPTFEDLWGAGSDFRPGVSSLQMIEEMRSDWV